MPRDISTIPFATRREAMRFAEINERAKRLGGEVPATAAAGGVTAGGTLTGAPAFGYAGAYGGIPQVPSPGASQAAAVGANLGNTGQLFDLAGQTNQFNTAQALAALQANLPGYDAMAAKSSANIQANQNAQVNPDVLRNLQQMAAERGTMIGSPGSTNVESGLLRALGLTSYDLQNLGEQQFSGAVARTPVGPQFNPAAMYLSPDDWQSAQMAANLYASAPIPAQAAAANLNALRSGVGAGAGSSQPSNSQQLLNMLPRATPSPSRMPSIPSMPQATYRPAPVAPGRDYDPNAYASSTLASAVEGVTSPYTLGGYNYNAADANAGAEVSPELEAWARGDFGDIFGTFRGI